MFKCAADGIPKPLIKWELAGGGILPTGGREYVVSRPVVNLDTKQHQFSYSLRKEWIK